ncbi:hypothetical protein WKH56_06300 [Priestia sp. SB1]|uniref:hypothetical protein n=1 Tax=Priestia sp. SB1 TaxID=3132359 RepID=UPI0031763AE1
MYFKPQKAFKTDEGHTLLVGELGEESVFKVRFNLEKLDHDGEVNIKVGKLLFDGKGNYIKTIDKCFNKYGEIIIIGKIEGSAKAYIPNVNFVRWSKIYSYCFFDFDHNSYLETFKTSKEQPLFDFLYKFNNKYEIGIPKFLKGKGGDEIEEIKDLHNGEEFSVITGIKKLAADKVPNYY